MDAAAYIVPMMDEGGRFFSPSSEDPESIYAQLDEQDDAIDALDENWHYDELQPLSLSE